MCWRAAQGQSKGFGTGILNNMTGWELWEDGCRERVAPLLETEREVGVDFPSFFDCKSDRRNE
jgi:hypothetical protein